MAAVNVSATCRDTKNPRTPAETDSKQCTSGAANSTITKTLHWNIYWLDGYVRPLDITDTGQMGPEAWGCHECWPGFDTPYWSDDGTTAYWYQKTYHAYFDQTDSHCWSLLTDDHRQGHTCRTPGTCKAEVQDWFSYPSTGCITGLLFGGPCTRSSEFQSRC